MLVMHPVFGVLAAIRLNAFDPSRARRFPRPKRAKMSPCLELVRAGRCQRSNINLRGSNHRSNVLQRSTSAQFEFRPQAYFSKYDLLSMVRRDDIGGQRPGVSGSRKRAKASEIDVVKPRLNPDHRLGSINLLSHSDAKWENWASTVVPAGDSLS